MVYDPLAQTCLFDSGWWADGNADGRRRLRSDEDSVAVCVAGVAEAVAKSEATTKQELQAQLDELKGQNHELKERMDEMQAMLRQLLVKR